MLGVGAREVVEQGLSYVHVAAPAVAHAAQRTAPRTEAEAEGEALLRGRAGVRVRVRVRVRARARVRAMEVTILESIQLSWTVAQSVGSSVQESIIVPG